MFSFFSRKKEVERVAEDTKKGFESVKTDMSAISKWIKYLDSEKNLQKKEVGEIKQALASVFYEIEELKNMVQTMHEIKVVKQPQTPKQMFNKQTAVYDVQTGVQTDVQTPKLQNFSITERAIIWILLNTDLKLSYDDLAAMLGKEKSTIRGQINTIKQKNMHLIEEIIEKNGKKRVYIQEEIKEKLLKKVKIGEKKRKKQ